MLSAEEQGSGPRPEFVKGLPFEDSLVNDALGLGAVDHFPEFADYRSRGEVLAEEGFKVAAAPDAFHGQGFKE